MKKLFVMVLAAAAVLLSCVSCKNEKPLFDLAVEAEVFTDSGVTAKVNAQVANVATYYFYENGTPIAQFEDLSAKEKARIDRWINKEVAKQVKKLPNGANWRVHIKGYLKYYVTVEIDRTFPEE